MHLFQPLTPHLRTLGAAALVAVCAWATQAQAVDVLGTQVVQSAQVRAELVAHAPQGATAGKTVWVALKLQHAQGWHTYWKNPGDSGLPTQFEWQLPPGVAAGAVHWPTPKKFPLGPLANFGYDGTVLLPTPIVLPESWAEGSLTVRLNASWLVCRTECIPEDGQFRVTLSASAPPTLNGLAFEDALQRSPKESADSLAKGQANVNGAFLDFSSDGLPKAWRNKTLTVFPETPNLIEPGAAWEQSWRNGRWTARLPLSGMRTDSPTSLNLVIAANEGLAHGQQALAGVRLGGVPVTGTWPPVSLAPGLDGVSPALAAALESNASTATRPATESTTGLLVALLGALAGGLMLNLMPCVFPVLAIKVLAFTQMGNGQTPSQARSSHRAAGVAYTAGVVLSFVTLGGVLVGLRAAGEQLGWGFQLQNPGVVAALATLFAVLGLNLAGVFEFNSILPSYIMGLKAKNPTIDSFLTGVLATAVASPCTAPFMGASLGLAVGFAPPQAMAVFACVGVGMALPYLLASWMPALARGLPKPGAWMLTFKQFMAFPMFGTVVWLVWVLGQQIGVNGAAALLALLVLVAMWVWALSQRGQSRWWLSTLSTLALVGGLYGMGPWVVTETEAPVTPSATVPPPGTWGNWAPKLTSELTQAGHTVFVDYTAAWCVTCQYNKRTTLSHPDVLADFAQLNVVLLRADWTRRDPAVTDALAAVGRSGVPTYVLYRPGKPAKVLSEVLSVAEVRQALAQP